MRNLLYVHGLDSSPRLDKLSVLEPFCDTLHAPLIGYRKNPQVFPELLDLCQKEKINCIVGSSAGGLMAYWLVKSIGGKALLFNPALSMLEHRPDIPHQALQEVHLEGSPYHIIFGKKDEVVPYQPTLDYLKGREGDKAFSYDLLEDLGHTIPLEVFQEACFRFFQEKYG